MPRDLIGEDLSKSESTGLFSVCMTERSVWPPRCLWVGGLPPTRVGAAAASRRRPHYVLYSSSLIGCATSRSCCTLHMPTGGVAQAANGQSAACTTRLHTLPIEVEDLPKQMEITLVDSKSRCSQA
jgi:hypothetical protein